MKHWAGQLQEKNGEQEYGFEHIIEAPDIDTAETIYHNYARHWYDDDEVTFEDGWYNFFGGGVSVRIRSIKPTTIRRWLEYRYNEGVIREVKEVKQ